MTTNGSESQTLEQQVESFVSYLEIATATLRDYTERELTDTDIDVIDSYLCQIRWRREEVQRAIRRRQLKDADSEQERGWR